MAQTPENPEPIPSVEQVKGLDLQPAMERLDLYIDFGAEPRFFQEMQRRAESPDADKWFTLNDLDGRAGYEMRYNDDGLTEDKEINKTLTDVYFKHEITQSVDPSSQLDLFATTDTINMVMGVENNLESDRRTGPVTSDAILFKYFDNLPEGIEEMPQDLLGTGNLRYAGRQGKIDNDTWFLLSVTDGQVVYQYSKLEFIDQRTREPFAPDLQSELFAQREEFEKARQEN